MHVPFSDDQRVAESGNEREVVADVQANAAHVLVPFVYAVLRGSIVSIVT